LHAKFELVINLKTASALGLESANAACPRRRSDRMRGGLLQCSYVFFWVRFCLSQASGEGAYRVSVTPGWEGQKRAITASKPPHSITASALEIVDGERNNGASSALLSISTSSIVHFYKT
jgi:hypothetical protein